MGLVSIDLGPKRRCRKAGHVVNAEVERCPVCDSAFKAAYYERRKEQVREYNAKYNQRAAIKEYRRKKTAEYRLQESVRLAHNTQERQRRKDARYRFVRVVRGYGLEVVDFAHLLKAQDFKCVGCREALNLDRRTHIDHCHKTGRVRGILCHFCNLVLGQAKDRAEVLRRLADYLEWTKAAEPKFDDNGRLIPWAA